MLMKKELIDDNKKLKEENRKQKEEIERLNKKIEQYENPEDMTLMFMWCNEKAKDEIERLNNIINKLNYGIKELDDMFYETFRISQNGYYSISEWELKEFTDKLQELKGVDKE